MPFGFQQAIAGANAALSIGNSLFGGDEQYLLKKSIKRLLKKGQEGIDKNVFQNLQTQTSNRFGNQTAANRSAAISRLQRQGVPVQVQEQILGDINTSGAGARAGALGNLSFANEQFKMDALRSAGGLAQGLGQSDPSAGLSQSLMALLNPGQNELNPFGGQEEMPNLSDDYLNFRKRYNNQQQYTS